MKSILLAAIFLGVALASASADLIVPKPTRVTVLGIAAFPKVQFTIALGDEPAQKLEADKNYDFKTEARLYVEDGDHPPKLWATVKHESASGRVVKLTVSKVQPGKDGLEVSYDTHEASWSSPHAPHSTRPPHRSFFPLHLPFGLMVFGGIGLVLLARRRDLRG